MTRFVDSRLAALNAESGLEDAGMRTALENALQPGETATASYSVSAHIWFDAVLTDRAVLLIKGALRPRVTRVPLPIDIKRHPAPNSPSVRVRTPLGTKTLWGSNLDPTCQQLITAGPPTKPPSAHPRRTAPIQQPAAAQPTPPDEPKRAADSRPRKPRRQRIRKLRSGFPPPSTTWDLADNCIKCGRPLTDPRSRQARVGTKCIRIYGTQQRRIPNPAHERWRATKTKNDVDYAARKAHAEAEYLHAKASYEQARREWRAVRSRR